jgi:hypothetical protein
LGVNNSESNESIMKWFHEGITEGENGIVIYPNLQTFRQIYRQYAKDQLAKEEDDDDDEKIIIHAMNNQIQESYLLQLFTKQSTA